MATLEKWLGPRGLLEVSLGSAWFASLAGSFGIRLGVSGGVSWHQSIARQVERMILNYLSNMLNDYYMFYNDF